MDREFCIEAAVCTEYEKLLEECNSALNIWNEKRAAVCESRVNGQKKIGDELLRLQARYAKAYTVLQNHAKGCPQCQMVSRIEERDSGNDSESLSDSNLYAWTGT